MDQDRCCVRKADCPADEPYPTDVATYRIGRGEPQLEQFTCGSGI